MYLSIYLSIYLKSS